MAHARPPLSRVKREVHDRCPYVADPARNDTWRLLNDGEAGDCEDLALTLRARLAALGCLAPAICKTEAGQRHMVLLVVTAAGVYVADNRFAHIAPWAGLPYAWEICLGPDGWQTILPKT